MWEKYFQWTNSQSGGLPFYVLSTRSPGEAHPTILAEPSEGWRAYASSWCYFVPSLEQLTQGSSITISDDQVKKYMAAMEGKLLACFPPVQQPKNIKEYMGAAFLEQMNCITVTIGNQNTQANETDLDNRQFTFASDDLWYAKIGDSPLIEVGKHLERCADLAVLVRETVIVEGPAKVSKTKRKRQRRKNFNTRALDEEEGKEGEDDDKDEMREDEAEGKEGENDEEDEMLEDEEEDEEEEEDGDDEDEDEMEEEEEEEEEEGDAMDLQSSSTRKRKAKSHVASDKVSAFPVRQAILNSTHGLTAQYGILHCSVSCDHTERNASPHCLFMSHLPGPGTESQKAARKAPRQSRPLRRVPHSHRCASGCPSGE